MPLKREEINISLVLVRCSVSVRVQKEDVCSHPDLEFWTHSIKLIANGDYTDNLNVFGIFYGHKTSILVLTENLVRWVTYKGHPFMTSTSKSGFLVPPPVHMRLSPPLYGRPHAINMKYA